MTADDDLRVLWVGLTRSHPGGIEEWSVAVEALNEHGRRDVYVARVLVAGRDGTLASARVRYEARIGGAASLPSVTNLARQIAVDEWRKASGAS